MEPTISVPEDLAELSNDALVELGHEIEDKARELSAEAASSDDVLNEVERLAAEYDRINVEMGAREAAEVERADRAASALSRFAEPEAETDTAADTAADTDEADTDASDEMSDQVDDTEAPAEAAAATEDTDEAASDKDATDEADTAETVEMADDSDDSADQTQAEVEVTATSATVSVPTVERLRRNRPAAVEPTPQEEDPMTTASKLIATAAASGLHEGKEMDFAELAKSVARKHHGLGHVPEGTFERIILASSVHQFDRVVGNGAEENFSIFNAVRREAAANGNAIVAAGGSCAPLSPSYDFFRIAEPQSPVEGCLPVVGAERGGIRYIVPPDFRDASGGVRVTTYAEDQAGYPPTAPKPCVRVTCPPVDECFVDAVSACVTWGNLNHRVFPEQVEAFMQDLAVIFAETKEIFYLDAIDTASTPVTSTGTYGASRSLFQDYCTAAANYRRRHHMAPDAPLQVLLPSWAQELFRIDMVNDHSRGLRALETCDNDLDRALACCGLVPCWYYDSATGAGQAFNDAQGVGVLNPFPSTVVGYLYAPGTFVRLDGGTLDLGIVRDSTLNSTNDLQMFSEQWIQVCQVGLESLRIESTVCPNGTAPEPVVPFAC